MSARRCAATCARCRPRAGCPPTSSSPCRSSSSCACSRSTTTTSGCSGEPHGHRHGRRRSDPHGHRRLVDAQGREGGGCDCGLLIARAVLIVLAIVVVVGSLVIGAASPRAWPGAWPHRAPDHAQRGRQERAPARTASSPRCLDRTRRLGLAFSPTGTSERLSRMLDLAGNPPAGRWSGSWGPRASRAAVRGHRPAPRRLHPERSGHRGPRPAPRASSCRTCSSTTPA